MPAPLGVGVRLELTQQCSGMGRSLRQQRAPQGSRRGCRRVSTGCFAGHLSAERAGIAAGISATFVPTCLPAAPLVSLYQSWRTIRALQSGVSTDAPLDASVRSRASALIPTPITASMPGPATGTHSEPDVG